MAGYHRPLRHFEQLRPQESGTGWVVLWETRRISDESRWSAAGAGSEKEALERAQHFLRLGFHVHAIRDPLGSVFMDEQAIASRFGAARRPEPDAAAKRESPTPARPDVPLIQDEVAGE